MQLKPIGTAFVSLIKMMIAPVIFCTIVLGVGSIAKAATVGKVGGLALGYFIAMSTFALAIGLVVGNLIHPGEGLMVGSTGYEAPASEEAGGTAGFLLGIIPETLVLVADQRLILQTLFVALLVGFALQRMGARGATILEGGPQPAGAGVPHPRDDHVGRPDRRVRRHRGRRRRDRRRGDRRPRRP